MKSYLESSYAYNVSSYNALHTYTINSYAYQVLSYNALRSYVINSYAYQVSSYNNLLSYSIETRNSYNALSSYVNNLGGDVKANRVKSLIAGNMYIWRGTAAKLPAKRYKNVIYIVTEEENDDELYVE